MRLLVCLIIAFAPRLVYGQQNQRTFRTDYSEACTSDVFSIVEEMPQYKGGILQLELDMNNSFQKEDRVDGLYYVNIHINCKGKSYGFQVVKGTTDEGNHALVSTLEKLQNWIPGEHLGQPVDCMKLIKVSVGWRKILVGET